MLTSPAYRLIAFSYETSIRVAAVFITVLSVVLRVDPATLVSFGNMLPFFPAKLKALGQKPEQKQQDEEVKLQDKRGKKKVDQKQWKQVESQSSSSTQVVQQQQGSSDIQGLREELQKQQDQIHREHEQRMKQMNTQNNRQMKKLEEELRIAKDLIRTLKNKKNFEQTSIKIEAAQEFPDLKEEIELETKLANLLNSRLEDSKLAQQYKDQIEALQAQFNKTIEVLNNKLTEETLRIQEQQREKSFLEEEVKVAKNVIDSLKSKVEEEHQRALEALRTQQEEYERTQQKTLEKVEIATTLAQVVKGNLEQETHLAEDLQEQNKKLNAQIEKQNRKIKKLTERLETEKKRTNDLKILEGKEVTAYENKLSDLNKLLDVQATRVRFLEDELNKQKRTYEQELIVAKGLIDTLKKQVEDEVLKEKIKWEDILKVYKVKMDKLQEEAESATRKAERIQGQLEIELLNLENLSVQQKRLEEESSTLSSRATNAERRLNIELDRVSELEARVKRDEEQFQKRKEHYEVRINDLVKELEQEKTRISALEHKPDLVALELNSQIKELNKKLVEADSRVFVEVNNAEEKFRAKQREFENSIDSLNAELKAERERTIHLQSELHSNIEAERALLLQRNEYIKGLEEELTTAKDLINTLRTNHIQEVEQLKRTVRGDQAELETDQMERTRLEREVDSFRTLLTAEQEKSEQLRLQLRQLEEKQSEERHKDEAIDYLKKQLQASKTEIDQLQDRIKQVNTMQEQIDHKEQELHIARGLIDVLKSQIPAKPAAAHADTAPISS